MNSLVHIVGTNNIIATQDDNDHCNDVQVCKKYKGHQRKPSIKILK